MLSIKKIALVGASDTDSEQFRVIVDQAARKLHTAWQWVPESDADLVVIDMDSIYGHMTWLKAQNAGKRVAVLTANANNADSDLIVTKPIDAIGVINMLNLAALDAELAAPVPAPRRGAREAPKQAAGAAPPAKPPATGAANAAAAGQANSGSEPAAAEVPVVAAPPAPRELYLADFIGGELAGPAQLRVADLPALVLDPASETYYAAGTFRALMPICLRPLRKEDWHSLSPAEFDKLKTTQKPQPYSRLLWLYTLASSNGQLLSELNPNTKYKLARWPQIEREFGKHFRIATAMMQPPASLTDIAEKSGATLVEVIDFTNAYFVIGYIELESWAALSAKGVENSGKPSGRMDLLSRLRKRLGG